MKKKFISIIVVLSMLCTFVPCVTYAEEVANGTCGDVMWTLDSDGTLTISGTGRAYVSLLNNLLDYTSDITKIVVESSVTELVVRNLNECTQMTTLEISDTVTDINFPNDRFPALQNINVNAENSAFSSVDGVLLDKSGKNLIQYPIGRKEKVYTIPNEITSLDGYAFSYSNLTKIIIPTSVSEIYAPFGWCYDLTKIEVAEDNPYYTVEDGVLFDKEKTKIVAYPTGKTETSYTIPSTVTQIEGCAFAGNEKIETVEIPNTLKKISFSAFDGCSSLKDVEIPATVESIGSEVFQGCTSIKSIELPEKITNLGLRAFAGCTALEKINIPNTVTEIEEEAFYNCKSLEEITIPNGITEICSYTFYGCKSLQKVIIPGSVTRIWEYAFYGCSNLERLTLQEGVKNLEYNSFRNCSIEKAIIPNTLEYFDEAFGTSYPYNIYYNGTEEEWNDLEKRSEEKYLFESATVHFEPKPIITDTPVVTVDDNTYIAQVSLKNVLVDSCLVMAAYSDGALVGMESEPLTLEITSEEISVNAENADEVKVFVWDSLSGAQPMCKSYSVDIIQ